MKDEDRSVFDLEYQEPMKSISYGKSEDQVIDFYHPEVLGKPLIVLIHGGFWRSEYDRKHLSPLAKKLSELGWPVALIEYRRIIGNPDATISDVSSAIDLLKQQYEKVILIGHSAGGHLALILAKSVGPSGVIALAPITNLQAAQDLDLDEGAVSDFLGVPANMRSDIDPIRLGALEFETLLIHGSLDIRVPVSFSTEYVAEMDTPTTRFLEIPSAGHFQLIDPSQPVFMEILGEVNKSF